MTVKEYHRVYLDDIRNKKPLTEDEILSQIKLDYEITEKEDIENANNSLAYIMEFVKKLMNNRIYEEQQSKRILNEFSYRNRILDFFPMAHSVFIRKWEDENRKDAFSSDEYATMVKKQAIRLQESGVKRKNMNSLENTLADFDSYFDKK